MINVLFICHGNICRSPMAEYIFRDMVQRQGLAERFHIASAATSREEIGNDIYPPARAELRAHGIPVGHRAAVQVTPRDYDAYDWLLTMDENNARNLRRILPQRIFIRQSPQQFMKCDIRGLRIPGQNHHKSFLSIY